MELIKRWKNNPLLGPEPSCPWGSGLAMNPGVVYDGKKFHMLFTAGPNRPDRQLYLGYASSEDGFNFERAPEPFIKPSDREGDFDWGTVDDARITTIGDTHYITYAARAVTDYIRNIQGRLPKNIPNKRPTWTAGFRRTGLASTKDFKSVKKLGPITSEFVNDANVILFPEKIKGKYVMLHRPTPFIAGNHACYYTPARMFITFSENLLKWFEDDEDTINRIVPNDFLLIEPEQEWEEQKVGGAGVPIKTDEGWLLMYHAKDRKRIYRCGLLLLDIENPTKVIARTPKPVFEPETDIELHGRYPGCVFPCAHIAVGKEVFIYYGAGDEYVCLATAKLKKLLEHVLRYRI